MACLGFSLFGYWLYTIGALKQWYIWLFLLFCIINAIAQIISFDRRVN